MSSAPTTSATAATDTTGSHKHGLPLWAIILIGVLVPLLVLGLIGLLLLCCLRRRRRHRHRSPKTHIPSRTPTPAFLSTTYRTGPANPPGEQHVPLKSGHLSRGVEPDHEFLGQNKHHSSSSEEYRTPIGGPSYENIPQLATTNTQNLRRSSRHSSRHSSTSLHSVPEMPEPMHSHHNDSPPMPLPPRSPHRSQDFSQEADLGGNYALKNNHRVSSLEPSYNNNYQNDGAETGPYYNQGIYAGGLHSYPNAHHTSDRDHRPYSDPFSDPSSPRHSGHSYNRGHGDLAGRDPELFLDYRGRQQDPESNWPLRTSEEGGYRTPGRTRSYDRYYEKEKVYEM
jgi:hypothetical protein